jgi:NAD(P)H-dependent FMN reductase
MAKIKVILGTTRDARVGKKIADWVIDSSKEIKDSEFELIDLKDYNIPFFNLPISPAYKEPEYNTNQKALQEKINEADGFVFVTPEYNHGYTSVLKNVLDTYYNEWRIKPATFVSYGGISGGIRAVESLRLVLIELQMVPIRSSVHIPFIFNQFNEDGLLKEETKEASNLKTTLEDISWWSNILKNPRSDRLKV